jgi:type IV pilus assembly protein PilF
MWREMRVLAVGACVVLAAGCGFVDRLTFIRPSTGSGKYTQIAPRYDVTGGRKPGQDPGDATMLLASATVLYQRGQLADAEGLARKALKAQPGSGDAHTLLGLIASARGDEVAAGKFYQAAAAAAPGNGIYANNYGGWLCANGRAGESLDWFDRALADPAYPTPVAAMANAGECAVKAGQPVRAESSWRGALALDANNLAALAGMAALEFDNGHYMEARAFAERWLALAPDDAAGLSLAAQTEQKLGDNVAASRYRSRLQAISSGSNAAPRTQ